MDPNESGGRHRRRRANRVARTTLDEARRAGLVQRHLTKLRYLASRSLPDAAGGPLGELVHPAPHASTRETAGPEPTPIPAAGTETAA